MLEILWARVVTRSVANAKTASLALIPSVEAVLPQLARRQLARPPRVLLGRNVTLSHSLTDLSPGAAPTVTDTMLVTLKRSFEVGLTAAAATTTFARRLAAPALLMALGLAAVVLASLAPIPSVEAVLPP